MQELEQAARQALEALNVAFPIIQHEKFVQDASYGKNFVEHKAARAQMAHDKTKDAIQTLRAALEQPAAPVVPDGWKLVPVEPTHEMLGKGQREWLDSDGADPSYDVYRAMLAVAPEPAAEEAQKREHDLKDVRCECCGYMTYQREHMGCIRAANQQHTPAAVAQEPVEFLAGGARFKTSVFPYGVCINGLPKDLAGRWVALVAAEDDRHLTLTNRQPRQPLTDEQITEICKAVAKEGPEDSIDRFVRAIEAAHGIKG